MALCASFMPALAHASEITVYVLNGNTEIGQFTYSSTGAPVSGRPFDFTIGSGASAVTYDSTNGASIALSGNFTTLFIQKQVAARYDVLSLEFSAPLNGFLYGTLATDSLVAGVPNTHPSNTAPNQDSVECIGVTVSSGSVNCPAGTETLLSGYLAQTAQPTGGFTQTVPEPMTAAILVSGIAGLRMTRRRNAR
jgi:hypothetical protein